MTGRGHPYFDGGPAWVPTQTFTDITGTSAVSVVGLDSDTSSTPPNGGKWIVDDIVISADANTVVTIQDNAGTPIVIVKIDLPGGGPPAQLTPRDGFRLAGLGKKVQAKSSNAVNLRVFTSAHEEAA